MIARFNGIDYIPMTPLSPRFFLREGERVQPLMVVFVSPMFTYQHFKEHSQKQEALTIESARSLE